MGKIDVHRVFVWSFRISEEFRVSAFLSEYGFVQMVGDPHPKASDHRIERTGYRPERCLSGSVYRTATVVRVSV